MPNKRRFEVYVYPNAQAKALYTAEGGCKDFLYGEAFTLSKAKALAAKATQAGFIYHETIVYGASGKAFFSQFGEYDDSWNYSE